MAYRPPVGVGMGSMLPRTGPSFARARLILAKQAGYLPPDATIAPGPNAVAQWRDVSKNLSANARGAGFVNPIQWLRQGAATGTLPGTQPPTPPSHGNPQLLGLMQAMQSQGR